MDIRNLTTFVHVAELGSFSRAAEKLGYSQPTISVQIRQLEEDLAIRLFDRIGHAVRLTSKGQDMLPYAQRVCHLCQQMEHAAGQMDDVSGVIRMATADSLCAPLIHKGFAGLRKEYPNICIELTTAGTNALSRLLDQNEVDIVCTLDSHIYNTNYVIAHEEQIGVHFVVPAGSPLLDHSFLNRQDLLCQDLLLTERGMSYRRLLDEWLAQDSIAVQPVLENGSAELLCQLVEAGMGISFLPDYVTEGAVQRGTVVRMQAEGFTPKLWKQILYRKDKWVSPPMQVVLDHMTGILLSR